MDYRTATLSGLVKVWIKTSLRDVRVTDNWSRYVIKHRHCHSINGGTNYLTPLHPCSKKRSTPNYSHIFLTDSGIPQPTITCLHPASRDVVRLTETDNCCQELVTNPVNWSARKKQAVVAILCVLSSRVCIVSLLAILLDVVSPISQGSLGPPHMYVILIQFKKSYTGG
jgi:hypothetical protein